MSTTNAHDLSNSPAAWFAVLEAARRKGDAARAQRAESELRRLGVRVEWDEPNHQQAEGREARA